ncbi:hypothetical protein EYF80_022095 [Liparis tanakae]|uniref:Uncharacterized protein n=1 Tax=Liparis tanakae TaxID=230148 RepID=A0A4Z2HPY1_9TELE|nr:hypothetical protein EYF80_022095 [Liparis tanakae]
MACRERLKVLPDGSGDTAGRMNHCRSQRPRDRSGICSLADTGSSSVYTVINDVTAAIYTPASHRTCSSACKSAFQNHLA